VAEFLAQPKTVGGRVYWSQKGHPDYQEASLIVAVTAKPEILSRLVMTASTSRDPRKYSFALLLGSGPVLRLDVNPGSTHFDPVTLTSVAGTHWQPWPCSSAEPDDRQFNHLGWLNEFLTKAAITSDIEYNQPPYAAVEQLGLEEQ
jgi:hypothetical protein